MIIDGKKLADAVIESLQKEVALLREQGVVPAFGILLIGDNLASQLYVSMKQKTAEGLCMNCVLVQLATDVSEEDALKAINDLNSNQALHGVMMQLPVPQHLSRERLCSAINPVKDIDCLNPETFAKLEDGDTSIRPPTAESVARLIVEGGVSSLQDASIIVVGSGFFARQIVSHLKNKGGRVENVSFHDVELQEKVRQADIVVAALGRPEHITADMIKQGAVVIDVGVTRRGDAVVGDVAFDEVSKKASAITPVPGGVGPLTVAYLLKNVVDVAKRTLTKK